jgi:putative phage-type endonuclease
MQWLNVKQGTQEWHDLRTKYYKTASRTPIVLGISPFSTKEALIKELLENKKPFQNKAMKQGIELESHVRELINRNSIGQFTPKVALDGEYLASLDGYDESVNTLIEIKVSRTTYQEIIARIIPNYYEYQVQHQLMVSGAKSGFLIAYNPDTEDYAEVKILPDPKKWDEIKKAWDEFDEFLATYEESEVELTDEESLELAEAYSYATNQIAYHTQKANDIKQRLLEKVSATKTKVRNLIITRTEGRTSYDYKGFLDSKGLKLTDEFKKKGASSYQIRIKDE